MCKIERRWLEIRVVEEIGEDSGEVLVNPRARLSALGAGLRIIGRWIEGYYAPNFEDSVGRLRHD